MTTRVPGRGAHTGGVVAIVPDIDEEATIAGVVEALLALPVDRVLVVDGGSADATAEHAAAAGAEVVAEHRRGYGRACLTGARHAVGADVLLFCDGDGSDVVSQGVRLLAPLAAGGADLVIGSRLRGHRGRGAMAPHQAAGNRLVSALLRRRHGVGVTDVGPFRAVRASVLHDLGMREMSYGWPTEMIVRAAQAGHRVLEVPVDYRVRAGGRSKVSGSARASVLAAWHMLRVAWASPASSAQISTSIPEQEVR
jgi:glycosyltransferase involved in cell wall biosynthesis